MREIIYEIRKCVHPSVLIIAVIGVVLGCLISVGYTTYDGQAYSILELILRSDREFKLSDIDMNSYSIWKKGIGNWSRILLPFLLGLGYLTNSAAERECGGIRYRIIREGYARYCVSKLFDCMLSGGIILVLGYAIYGVIIAIFFPGISSYPQELVEIYSYYGGVDGVSASDITVTFLHVFLYGLCVNVFAFFISIFLTDRYMMFCLPVLIKYMLMGIIARFEKYFLNKDSSEELHLVSSLNMEEILYDRWSDYIGLTIGSVLLLYIASFVIYVAYLRKEAYDVGLC